MKAVGPLLLIGAAAAWACFAITRLNGADPMIGVEVAGLLLLAGWSTATALALVGAWRLGRIMRANAVIERRHGIRFGVVHADLRMAMVTGVVRPMIFVTTATRAALSDDELRAVLLHEEHHRRTRAPLRTALLEGWLRLFGGHRLAQRWVEVRIGFDEIEADQHALRHGSARSSLAQALLKIEPGPGRGFASGDEMRASALLDDTVTGVRAPLIEWLPLVVVVAMIIGCRLAGADTPL